jgi:very-short-patch-repair endonuclease
VSPRLRASHLGLDLQCRFAELTIPVAEYRFHPTRKWRFDFAWPTERLAVEVNGGAFASGGGRHTRGAGFRSDAEKLSEAAILGWRVIHVLPEQIRNGLAVELVRRALTPSPSGQARLV